MTNEEKKRLSYLRQNAVRQAWKDERNRVLNGRGTRDWTTSEQQELISRGSVTGYDGHHMKSVQQYPEEAGNKEIIQFLTEKEHFEGAHSKDYHNATNGYYDVKNNQTIEFTDTEDFTIPEIALSDPILCQDMDSSETEQIKKDIIDDISSGYNHQNSPRNEAIGNNYSMANLSSAGNVSKSSCDTKQINQKRGH